MFETSTLYLFEKNFEAFWDIQSDYPDAKALWYDGSSSIIEGLFDFVHPKELIVSHGLDLSKIEKQLPPGIKLCYLPEGPVRAFPVKPTCVVPSNDTHVHLLQAFRHIYQNIVFVAMREKSEKAFETLEQLKIPALSREIGKLEPHLYNSLVLANDWGGVELSLVNHFRKWNVPSVCVQESVIDFNDTFHRMEWCDYPVIQGLATLRHLNRNVYFLVGNPRYEKLRVSDLPCRARVLINCNFTYGIFEEWREQWISNIVSCCQRLGVEYLICQHPRDLGDLSGYVSQRSSASTIHNMILSSTIVVTRFSSLIHESIALGRRVLYYNPHGELMNYDFEPDQSHLSIVRDKEQLYDSLEQLLHCGPSKEDSFYIKYIMRHCGSADGSASLRLSKAIETITRCNLDRRPIPWSTQFHLKLHSLKAKIKELSRNF